MTRRSAAWQGGLAAVGLIAAYATWQREPERAPGAVTVVDASKADLTHVRFEDENNVVDLERGHGGSDPDLWLHVVAKPKAPPKPDPKAKTPPPAPPAPPPPRDLGGAEAAVKAYDQFAPLVSPRAFGVLDTTKLKELGLDAPTRKLDLTVKGDVHHFDVGQPPKAAGGELFLRDARDGRVYLLPRGALSDLQNPVHMADRRLHTFDLTDFDNIGVTSGGKRKDLVQLRPEARTGAGFAPAAHPDKPDQMAKNWHEAVWRLFAQELLGRGENPPGGKPTIALRIDYFDGKKPVGWLELGRVETPGMSEDAAANTEVYARTEHSVGWVKIHSGAQIIADAQKIIAAP